jgi:hypothetical protein
VKLYSICLIINKGDTKDLPLNHSDICAYVNYSNHTPISPLDVIHIERAYERRFYFAANDWLLLSCPPRLNSSKLRFLVFGPKNAMTMAPTNQVPAMK